MDELARLEMSMNKRLEQLKNGETPTDNNVVELASELQEAIYSLSLLATQKQTRKELEERS